MEQTFSSARLTLWHCLDSDHEDDSALVSLQNKMQFLENRKCSIYPYVLYIYICYTDIAKTPVALELMHSIDCALWTLVSLCKLTPEISKESTDEIQTVRSLRVTRGRKCWETNRKKSQLAWKKEGNKRSVMQSKNSFVSKWVQIFPPNSFLFTSCYEVQLVGNTIHVSPLDDAE